MIVTVENQELREKPVPVPLCAPHINPPFIDLVREGTIWLQSCLLSGRLITVIPTNNMNIVCLCFCAVILGIGERWDGT